MISQLVKSKPVQSIERCQTSTTFLRGAEATVALWHFETGQAILASGDGARLRRYRGLAFLVLCKPPAALARSDC